MSPDKEPAAAETHFGPLFSRIYSFFASHSRHSVRTYDRIAQEVAAGKYRRILDVGCGPGLLLSAIKSAIPESEVFGVDPSRSMVAIARKRLKKTGENNFNVSSGSSMSVPFQGKFDLIISSMSFHHWHDREKSLEYLSGFLDQKGMIAVYEHYREDSGKEQSQKVHHSLSEEEAGRISINGFQRKIKVEGDLISLTFSR